MGKETLSTRGNDYERQRAETVARNNSKLKELKLPTLAKTVMGGSNKKKRKDKEKVDSSKEKDNDYVPEKSDHEDDLERPIQKQQKIIHVPFYVSKQICYIAPQTVHKLPRTISTRRIPSSTSGQPLTQPPKQPSNDTQRKHPTHQKVVKKLTYADMILRNKISQAENVSSENFIQSSTSHLEGEHTISSRKTSIENRLRLGEDDPVPNLEEADPMPNLEQDDPLPTLELSSEDEDAANTSDDEELTASDDTEQPDSEKATIPEPKTPSTVIRGPTMYHDIHTRSEDKRLPVYLNEFGEPIGPIIDKKNMAIEFPCFLGTLSRDHEVCPLTCLNWRKMPNKDRVSEYATAKYMVPAEGKKWALTCMSGCWRAYKCRFKKKHYYKYDDDQTRWANRPRSMSNADFTTLLKTWKREDIKEKYARNKQRRSAMKNLHTAGPRSFALIREQMKIENPTKEPPSVTELYARTHQKKDGVNYKHYSIEETAEKIEELKSVVGYGYDENEAFLAVMGNDYKGKSKLYVKGGSKGKGESAASPSYLVPDEVVEYVKSSLLDNEMTKLHEMRTKLEEGILQKKVELENMQKYLDSQKDNLADEILTKIKAKLPPDVAQKYLS